MSPRNFAEQLAVLQRVAAVVPLSRLDEHLAGPRASRPVCAITFDDGYADNLYSALPALTAAGTAAVVFVSTGWTGRQEPFWWDVLAGLILGAGRRPDRLELMLGGEPFSWNGQSSNGGPTEGNRADLFKLHRELWRRLRMLPESDRSHALRQLQVWAGAGAALDPLARPMTANEVLALQRSGVVDIGAHARSHRSLTSISPDERRHEIEGSRQDCAELLGKPPVNFAYPHGEFDASTARLVQEAGFKRACGAAPGLVWDSSDRYRLSRMAVLDLDGEAFERKLRVEWLP